MKESPVGMGEVYNSADDLIHFASKIQGKLVLLRDFIVCSAQTISEC